MPQFRLLCPYFPIVFCRFGQCSSSISIRMHPVDCLMWTPPTCDQCPRRRIYASQGFPMKNNNYMLFRLLVILPPFDVTPRRQTWTSFFCVRPTPLIFAWECAVTMRSEGGLRGASLDEYSCGVGFL